MGWSPLVVFCTPLLSPRRSRLSACLRVPYVALSHGTLPWTPKVVHSGLGARFKDLLNKYKRHIRSIIKGNREGYILGGTILNPLTVPTGRSVLVGPVGEIRRLFRTQLGALSVQFPPRGPRVQVLLSPKHQTRNPKP